MFATRLVIVTAVAVRELITDDPKFAIEAKRLVEDAVVANKLVVVALVPVAFPNVKLVSVDELEVKLPLT